MTEPRTIEQALAEALHETGTFNDCRFHEDQDDVDAGLDLVRIHRDCDVSVHAGRAKDMAATEPMQAIACDAAVGRAMQRADFSLYPGEWDADWAWYCRFGTQPAYGGRTAFAAIAAALGEEATDD